MSAPRVLYVIDSLAPGGAERSLADMAPYLVDGGVHLEVAVLHDRPGLGPEIESRGVAVHPISGRSRRQWLMGVAQLIRRSKPDLVHTTLFESDIIGRMAAAATRVPVVSTLASTPYGPDHAAEAGISPVRLKGAQGADALTARLVRRFHAVSQAAADSAVTRLRVRADRVEVIPRGRDLARLGSPSPERRRDVRRALRIEGAGPVFIAVARQEPQKGLEVLIRAVPAVLDAHPRSVVLVAGREGRSSLNLAKVIEEVAPPGSVRLLGHRDDVADLLCASDVFVLPSRREGLPGAVLEAMAMGVPVVATDLPTVREAVPGERFALLVPPDDPAALARAMGESVSHPTEAHTRADAARARFGERFEISAVSRAMITFYETALRGGSR